MDFEDAYRVLLDFGKEYKCGIHCGFAKWLALGMYKDKLFYRGWSLSVGINPYYFQDKKVFYSLSTRSI